MIIDHLMRSIVNFAQTVDMKPGSLATSFCRFLAGRRYFLHWQELAVKYGY